MRRSLPDANFLFHNSHRCFRDLLLVTCHQPLPAKALFPNSKPTRMGDAKFDCSLLLSKSLHPSDQQLMTEAPIQFARERGGKGYATDGDSWVAAVEFSSQVEAHVLLSYGNSSEPVSKHRGDQLELM